MSSRAPVPPELRDVFPETAFVTGDDRLGIAGCLLGDLAAEFGTPLYVFDEATIRSRARRFRDALAARYPGRSAVCYAAKAYCAPWLLALLAEEDLGLDVVSGGELYAATTVDFPRERIYFHGNNKGEDELGLALDEGIGRVVVDNLDEIRLLGRLAAARGVRQPVLIRVGPAVHADTHAHLHTGGIDTKFGLGIATGEAAEGVRAVLAEPSLELRGLHAHIGSQISDLGPYRAAIDRVFAFAATMRAESGLELRELSPGGGYFVRYTPEAARVEAHVMVREVADAIADSARRHGFEHRPPDLTIEPGRSMIATSAIALYRVGSVKAIPGVRTYVAVDGGMADNVRPIAYGAAYTAVLADRVSTDGAGDEVAIAGKYCESGDVLVQRVRLPEPRVGDVVAIPAAGAYQLAMASNYNMAPRPAVVVVADGRARLVRRRETYAELLASEVFDHVGATRAVEAAG
jgi:diaminopimelate decarboxylase